MRNSRQLTSEPKRLTERIRSAYPNFRADQVDEFTAGFKRMIGDFGVSRTDMAVTRTIDNGGDFAPAIGTIRKYVPMRDASRDFQPCEKDGCQDGWRPAKDKAGNKAVVRCQCYHDWAGVV